MTDSEKQKLPVIVQEPGWDRKETKTLMDLGLSWEHARIAVGRIAEHRQRADLQGYERGYQDGHENGFKKAQSKHKPEDTD